MQTQLGDSRSGKLNENLLGFGRALRRVGIPVDSLKISLSLQALQLIDIKEREDCRAALFSVIVGRYQDRQVFNDLFDLYFKDPNLENKLLGLMLPRNQEKPTHRKKNDRARESLQLFNTEQLNGPKNAQKIELDASMTLSDSDRLKNADFNTLSHIEYQLVENLARQIPIYFPKILSRRYQVSNVGSKPAFQKILQQASRLDGDPIQIFRQLRKKTSLPLLILVDISGSMERYARLLLSFLHASTKTHPQTEVFSFGTSLTHLSSSFKVRDTDKMLIAINQDIHDFAGGTKLGTCLKKLNKEYQHLCVGKRTVVLLITDALDTGPIDVLQTELQKLKSSTRSILWLNPLMRYEAFEPIASGPTTVSKVCSKMLAIHNLTSLEQLSEHLKTLLN